MAQEWELLQGPSAAQRKETTHTEEGEKEGLRWREPHPRNGGQASKDRGTMTVSIQNRQLSKYRILNCSKEHGDEIKTMNKLSSLLQKYIICFHIFS